MSVTSAQVTTLLENVLFESATLAAQNAPSWTAIANLNSSTSTVAGLSAYLATQPEAQIAARVVEYYQGALARVPSAFEINYYVQQAEQGLSASTIAQGTGPAGVPLSAWVAISAEFAASPEFQADFGLTGGITASNSALVVTGFYTNILGRAPTTTEIQYYVNELTTGVPASALLQQFTESPEYQAKAATTIQANLTSSGVAAVATVAAGGDPLAQGGAPIGGLPSATNTNFALTTGVDTLTGGNGANTFIGVVDTTAGVATFGGADTVTGVGGSNTLLLTDGLANDTTVIPVGSTITGIQTITLKTAGNAGVSSTNTFDTSGIAGVTQVNITSSGTGTDFLTAATSTNVTDTTLNAGAVNIAGGLNDVASAKGGSVTISGSAGTVTVTQTTGSITVDDGTAVTVTGTNATVNIDQNSASSGNVAVTETANNGANVTIGTGAHAVGGTITVTETTSLAATTTSGTITATGGTTDSVTVNIAASKAATTAQNASAASLGNLTGGNISLTGGTATTSFSVTQTKAVAGTAGSAAVSATSGTAATKAAPGVAAVAATAGTPAAALVPGTLGIVDGGVTLVDANATVTSVSLTNYGNSTFSGNNLKTLNLSGTAGTLAITDAAAKNTTLALNLNAVTVAPSLTATGDGIKDASGTLTEVDVTTTGASKVSDIAGAAITTLKVGGTGSLTLTSGIYDTVGTAFFDGALATVAVSGSASFSDGGALASGLSKLAATLTSVTTTSSGTFTAALDDTNQTFVGAAGADTITLNANTVATKAITAGSASTNEVIFDGAGGVAGLTAATAAKVTGFQILGVTNFNGGTIDAGIVDATASKLDLVKDGAGTATVKNLATGASVAIDATFTHAIVVGYADANGAADTTALALAKNANVGALTLQDANQVGIGTLNITAASASSANTIATLTDNDLSNLTVGGGDTAAITKLTESANQATSLTITDNEATSLTIGTLTDDTLGSINFAGSGATTITKFDPAGNVTTLSLSNNGAHTANIATLTSGTNVLTTVTFGGSGGIHVGALVDADAVLTLSNNGSATDTVTTFASTTLTSLTVNGNVALGGNTGLVGSAITLGTITTGITVSAGTDNAHINVDITNGAAAAATDTITVGNSNNEITDASTAGAVKVTVGTGSNLIDLHTGSASTYLATVTLGAHTSAGPDELLVGHNAATTTNASSVITGITAGDIVKFTDTGTSVVNLSAANQTTVTAAGTLAAAVGVVDGLAGTVAHSATVFTWSGNTYVLESAAAGNGTLTANDTVIELVGTHTLSSTVTGGLFTVAS